MPRSSRTHPILIALLLLGLSACGPDPQSAQPGEAPAEATLSPQQLTDLARVKQDAGAYDEAIAYLQKALSADPQFAPAHYRMGTVYEQWDKREEAIAAYRKAVELAPDSAENHLALGLIYGKAVKNELAVKEYLQAARLNPGDAGIHFNIALEYWYLQDIPHAEEHYRKTLELDPKHIQARLNLAGVYEHTKEWEKELKEIAIAQQMGRESGNEQAVRIAGEKLAFLKGRIHMTEEEFKRKTQPPFE